MRTRGWGPLAEHWYSVCSMHREYQADCRLCNVGQWRRCLTASVGRLLFRASPRLWRWLANR